MRHSSVAIATLLVATCLGGAASAHVMVAGGSLQAACYDYARARLATPEALTQCDQALAGATRPRDRAATHVNRGIIYMVRGAYDRAQADFDRAIQLDPALAEGHVNRGAALLAQNDFAGAIASINRGLALAPQEPARAYFNRGAANEELGNLRAALDDYRRAADLAPNWSLPRAELARFRGG